MEAVFDVIRSLQLNFSQATVAGALIFIFGYAVGSLRIKKLQREKHGLEKAVMALNEELLYSSPVPETSTKSEAPVIGLKSKSYRTSPIAK